MEEDPSPSKAAAEHVGKGKGRKAPHAGQAGASGGKSQCARGTGPQENGTEKKRQLGKKGSAGSIAAETAAAATGPANGVKQSTEGKARCV
jgi:hypothetical protein